MNEKAWRHTLSPGLVGILYKVAKAVRSKNENRVHMQRDLTLDHNEYGNYQKLRYFGLIAKYKENGAHIAGYWLLTGNGTRFLRGQISMPRWIKTVDNHILEKSPDRVWIKELCQDPWEPLWQTDFPETPDIPEHEEQLAFC